MRWIPVERPRLGASDPRPGGPRRDRHPLGCGGTNLEGGIHETSVLDRRGIGRLRVRVDGIDSPITFAVNDETGTRTPTGPLVTVSPP